MYRDGDQVRFDRIEPRNKLSRPVLTYYEMADGQVGYIDQSIKPSHRAEKMYHVVGDGWSVWAWEKELTQVLDKPVMDENQLGLFEGFETVDGIKTQ